MTRPLVILSVLAFAAVPLVAEEPASFTFRFDLPGDFVRSLTVSEAIRIRDLGTEGRQEDHVTIQSVESRMRIADGFVLVRDPVAVKLERNGETLEDPIALGLFGLKKRLILDAEGRLRRVEGIEDELDPFLDQLPAEISERVRSSVSPDQIAAQENHEWNERFGALLGRTVSVGETWQEEGQTPLPTGGSLAYVETVKIAGTTPCGEATCLEILTTRESDAAGESAAGARLTSSRRVVMEPDGMRIHGESSEVSLVLTVPGPDGNPFEVTETERLSVSYTRE